MKAMTRQQLASCAGVTSKTLGNYINRHWDELWALGMRPYEILPPAIRDPAPKRGRVAVSSLLH